MQVKEVGGETVPDPAGFVVPEEVKEEVIEPLCTHADVC
jgi:hypothetical protein